MGCRMRSCLGGRVCACMRSSLGGRVRSSLRGRMRGRLPDGLLNEQLSYAGMRRRRKTHRYKNCCREQT
jgi:hypothetical protein